jgi:hypothetical protein
MDIEVYMHTHTHKQCTGLHKTMKSGFMTESGVKCHLLKWQRGKREFKLHCIRK